MEDHLKRKFAMTYLNILPGWRPGAHAAEPLIGRRGGEDCWCADTLADL
jgi:hypothetical protein